MAPSLNATHMIEQSVVTTLLFHGRSFSIEPWPWLFITMLRVWDCRKSIQLNGVCDEHKPLPASHAVLLLPLLLDWYKETTA